MVKERVSNRFMNTIKVRDIVRVKSRIRVKVKVTVRYRVRTESGTKSY